MRQQSHPRIQDDVQTSPQTPKMHSWPQSGRSPRGPRPALATLLQSPASAATAHTSSSSSTNAPRPTTAAAPDRLPRPLPQVGRTCPQLPSRWTRSGLSFPRRNRLPRPSLLRLPRRQTQDALHTRAPPTLRPLRCPPGTGASPGQSLSTALVEDLVFSFQVTTNSGPPLLLDVGASGPSFCAPTLNSLCLSTRPLFAVCCIRGSQSSAAMATTATMVQKADSPTLKRALAPPNTSFPSKKTEHAFSRPPTPPYHAPNPPRWPRSTGSRPPRSGPPAKARRASMQTSPRTFVPMPSFGAVFGEDASTGFKALSEAEGTSAHGSHIGRPSSSGNPHTVPFSSFHIHRDSRDSTSTASSDNSPTTTISTMDSSSVTDPSPGPSPESPIAKAAPTSFVADFRSRRADTGPQDSSPNTFFELQRPTTPAKKPRNLKNLGINTSTSLTNLRTNPTASLPVIEKKEKNSSAPPSPSFIKPPTPPKRRPSNLSLTISTPGSNENKPMRLIIPSTPALNRPALRHFQSSPSLPLCSPAVGPSGGMQLPSLRPIKTNPSGLAEVPYEMEEEEDQEPNFDIPQSREEKPAAYPNGPICIYPSGVFLYFEPTAEQACTFDVIINVASEVKNPFTTPPSDSIKDLDARRVDGPPAETVDFACLPERTKPSSIDTQSSSPTTPKATPILETSQPIEHVVNGKAYKTPEYIHMPWEHNTDIVPDLFKLVKTMDDRVQQGKRVLVHCQCGVSRSASLIVAYGLYKNPGMSVQEAYDVVKKRSKWIGPNMNLIMQLQEFRNALLRANETRPYHNQPFGARSAGLRTGVSTTTNRHSPFERDMPTGARTPRTAPLPPETDVNMQRASTGNIMSISSGPLSAPSGSSLFSPGFRQSWAASQTHFDLSPKSSPKTTPYVDPKGHVVPVLSITDDDRSVLQPEIPALSTDHKPEAAEDASLKPLVVPNFSRQLPLRKHDAAAEPERPRTSPSPRDLHVSAQPLGFGALRSPAVSSFSIPRLAPDHSNDPPLLSPTKTEFSINPWSRGDGMDSEPSPGLSDLQPAPPPMSPRADEFHMAALNQGEIDDSYGLLSPRATGFTLSLQPAAPSFAPGNRSSQDYDLTSPIKTEFPKDMWAPSDNMLDAEMASPRAAEFHMTPLKPRVADEDPFGLASPRQFDFPPDLLKKSDLTPPRNAKYDARRPSFQAIPPPSHLAQPEAVNGFASLNSTAQAPPVIHAPVAPPNLQFYKTPDLPARIDSLSTSPEPQAPESTDAPTSSLEASLKELPVTPTTPEHSAFLSTPLRQPAIRTRFSSPNMREQRRLHKLQTEMEAMLPNRVLYPPQAAVDLDALMSPRAEEFTRNPFHVDLRSSTDDNSPASSNETVKDGQNRTDWTENRQWTPKKSLEEDPRSPVQTGSSPIVRNIWDVLPV
ncbi:hypothetical protein BU26DRAFT_551234 [Trematosphaeria pertusa]|uniref:protein-tyrosine-phosphatase n=1 Tax=Trematosphaeria pertusa TaxID=390896 RepID=A0A6A6IG41_9PLEO|nr:uncharacterized protein BU26DRAFT_551234 [Trematosphaeria pertusa]KAF2249554.1 hypothetical protein BU26DRAFT_551234 [Trematosphaeria pertusa]